jgi:hypothetical protein
MELLLVVGKILDRNRGLTERLARYEQQLFPDIARTLQQSGVPRVHVTSGDTNQEVTQGTLPAKQLGSLAKTFASMRFFGFEKELEKSKPYQKIKGDAVDNSFTSSVLGSHAWTALSDISMAEISAVSVVALPIDWSDITNAYHYPRNKSTGSSVDLTKATLADIGKGPLTSQSQGVGIKQKTAARPLKQYNIVLIGGLEVDKGALALQVGMPPASQAILSQNIVSRNEQPWQVSPAK